MHSTFYFHSLQFSVLIPLLFSITFTFHQIPPLSFRTSTPVFSVINHLTHFPPSTHPSTALSGYLSFDIIQLTLHFPLPLLFLSHSPNYILQLLPITIVPLTPHFPFFSLRLQLYSPETVLLIFFHKYSTFCLHSFQGFLKEFVFSVGSESDWGGGGGGCIANSFFLGGGGGGGGEWPVSGGGETLPPPLLKG